MVLKIWVVCENTVADSRKSTAARMRDRMLFRGRDAAGENSTEVAGGLGETAPEMPGDQGPPQNEGAFMVESTSR